MPPTPHVGPSYQKPTVQHLKRASQTNVIQHSPVESPSQIKLLNLEMFSGLEGRVNAYPEDEMTFEKPANKSPV